MPAPLRCPCIHTQLAPAVHSFYVNRRPACKKGGRLPIHSPWLLKRSMAAVLLVEDNDDVREMMALALQLDGHAVRTAANGREALDLLKGGLSPCLILLDLMMPVMNGWELRTVLKQDPELCEIPIVVISAVTAELAQRLHDTEYVPKPVDIDRLLEKVCGYCREQDESSSPQDS